MNFQLDGSYVLVMLLVPMGLFVALATTPKWCVRSIGKHALWRLRDDVVDDVLAGRLPREHLAVRELIARAEWAISESRSLDLLHLAVWHRASRRIPDETKRELMKLVSLANLTTEQAAQVEHYRMRYNAVAIRGIFLSSWIGIALVSWVILPMMLGQLRHRVKTFHVVVQEATDEVAAETTIGRSAREFVTVKGPHREVVMA